MCTRVEGGHAAHFANIDQHSPFFSQERAPTSVAYAENQSMFLDSLIADGEWLARYARDRSVSPYCCQPVEQHLLDVRLSLSGIASVSSNANSIKEFSRLASTCAW